MTKNVFITGGLGQDGQILIRLLKKKKINLTIFYKKKKPKFYGKANFIKENLFSAISSEAISLKSLHEIIVKGNLPKDSKIILREDLIKKEFLED